MSAHSCPSGSCYAIGTWEGAGIHCDLPAGHKTKTFLEHLDEERGLRWLQFNGKINAWPGTREDHESFVARIEGFFRGT